MEFRLPGLFIGWRSAMNCKSHPLGKVLVAFVIALAAFAMPLSAGGPHDPAADPSPARATESRISVTATEDSSSIIFPQIADGGGYKTSLLLTNSSATDTMATVRFYSSAGAPLVVTISGAASSSFQVPIPARGSAKLTTSGIADSAAVGWSSVTTVPFVPLNGNAVFQFFTGPVLFSEASVSAAMPVSAVDFYADEEHGFHTGFALANSGQVPALGTLTLRRGDGTLFDTYPISVDPGHHVAAFLWQILRDAPSGRAEINLTSGCLAATALRYHTSSLFSTVSVGQPGFAQAGAAALFSPNGGVRERIITEIEKAQSTLDIAIYSFTADEIRDALIRARNRGVQVRILADTGQADNQGQGGEIPTLQSLGFNVKLLAGLQNGIMHDKYMIIDGRLLVTGSYNWSVSAESYNFENAVFIQGSALVQAYIEEFNRMWAR
jgi:hypothetical protein